MPRSSILNLMRPFKPHPVQRVNCLQTLDSPPAVIKFMTARHRLASPAAPDEIANPLFPMRMGRSRVIAPIPAYRLPKDLRAALAAEGTTRRCVYVQTSFGPESSWPGFPKGT